jgi:uncharacterized membrane protein
MEPEHFLTLIATWVVLIAEGAGIVIITIALVRSLIHYARNLIRPTEPRATERIRLYLGRALGLSLEFLLAADIVETAVAPSWEDIGKLAAIAAIRTLLNYFLQKEIQMEQQHPAHSDLGQQPHDDTQYSDFPERRESVTPVPQR